MAFVDGITPMHLSLRGSRIGAYSAPVDSRHHRRYRNEHDTKGRSLRRTAKAAQGRAQQRLGDQPAIVGRPTIRQEINTGIHEYQRDQKALVLSLREVEAALGKDSLKLNRANQQLQQLLEAGPRRAIKLATRCLAMRRKRPLPPDDTAQRLLESEKQDAQQLKASLEHRHATTVTLLQTLSRARQNMTSLIAQEKRATSLHDETHSGVVKRYQRPQGAPPPAVGMARELIQQARAAHEATRALMKAARASLSAVHKEVTTALQDTIAATAKTKAQTTLSKGQTKASLHQTLRAQGRAELASGLNKAPLESRYETTAQRASRPLVAQFSRRVGRHRTAAAWEESEQENRVLDKAARGLQQDAKHLSRTQQQLGQLNHDLARSMAVDQEVVRLRNRPTLDKRV
eukprot:m.22168 g.22168  ORF g.22168 m.22168 type:complete len:402 (-) comp11213_c0_seq1:20-1225(-)